MGGFESGLELRSRIKEVLALVTHLEVPLERIVLQSGSMKEEFVDDDDGAALKYLQLNRCIRLKLAHRQTG